MMKWEDAKTALRQAAPLPIGTVELAFEGEFTRFSNLMPHRPADIDFR